jgi:hypothetical protein
MAEFPFGSTRASARTTAMRPRASLRLRRLRCCQALSWFGKPADDSQPLAGRRVLPSGFTGGE